MLTCNFRLTPWSGRCCRDVFNLRGINPSPVLTVVLLYIVNTGYSIVHVRVLYKQMRTCTHTPIYTRVSTHAQLRLTSDGDGDVAGLLSWSWCSSTVMTGTLPANSESAHTAKHNLTTECDKQGNK